MMGYYGDYGYAPFGNFTFLGPVLMIVFWVIIIVLIVYLVRGGSRAMYKHTGHSDETALDVLEKRYARGEIDKKEFEDKKKDLI